MRMSPNPEQVLRRLDWTVVRRLDGLLQGDYRTLFRGFGVELADLREYQLGDDVRYIDWNVTARMQTPFVRQYIEDREVTAWFLLDTSASMDFGTVRTLKSNLAIDCASVLARLLTRHGNRLGAMLYSDRVDKVIPAMGGERQILRLIDALQRRPPARRAQATDLTPLLDAALRTLRRRSLVFIFSDFISSAGWHKPLSTLAGRHEVLAIRLFDPREMSLPDLGTVIMEDAETGAQLYVDTHDRGFRKRFVAAAEQRERDLMVAFRRVGVDVLSLSTEDDLVRAIVHFALLRKRRRNAAGSGVRGTRFQRDATLERGEVSERRDLNLLVGMRNELPVD